MLWSHLFSTILGVNAENGDGDVLTFVAIGDEEGESFESEEDGGID